MKEKGKDIVVFCNGGKAYKQYKKHFKKIVVNANELKSTSSTNAGYDIDDLAKEWQVVADCVNGENDYVTIVSLAP